MREDAPEGCKVTATSECHHGTLRTLPRRCVSNVEDTQEEVREQRVRARVLDAACIDQRYERVDGRRRRRSIKRPERVGEDLLEALGKHVHHRPIDGGRIARVRGSLLVAASSGLRGLGCGDGWGDRAERMRESHQARCTREAQLGVGRQEIELEDRQGQGSHALPRISVKGALATNKAHGRVEVTDQRLPGVAVVCEAVRQRIECLGKVGGHKVARSIRSFQAAQREPALGDEVLERQLGLVNEMDHRSGSVLLGSIGCQPVDQGLHQA